MHKAVKILFNLIVLSPMISSSAAMASIAIGDNAPAMQNFETIRSSTIKQNAIIGKNFDFGVFRNRVVVLVHWETWCGPCVREIPHLVQLQQKYGEQVVIVGMTNSKESDILQLFSKPIQSLDQNTTLTGSVGDNINYNILSVGQAEPSFKFFFDSTDGVPAAFLIGKNTAVESIKMGSAGPDFDNSLTALLRGESPSAAQKTQDNATLAINQKIKEDTVKIKSLKIEMQRKMRDSETHEAELDKLRQQILSLYLEQDDLTRQEYKGYVESVYGMLQDLGERYDVVSDAERLSDIAKIQSLEDKIIADPNEVNYLPYILNFMLVHSDFLRPEIVKTLIPRVLHSDYRSNNAKQMAIVAVVMAQIQIGDLESAQNLIGSTATQSTISGSAFKTFAELLTKNVNELLALKRSPKAEMAKINAEKSVTAPFIQTLDDWRKNLPNFDGQNDDSMSDKKMHDFLATSILANQRNPTILKAAIDLIDQQSTAIVAEPRLAYLALTQLHALNSPLSSFELILEARLCRSLGQLQQSKRLLEKVLQAPAASTRQKSSAQILLQQESQ